MVLIMEKTVPRLSCEHRQMANVSPFSSTSPLPLPLPTPLPSSYSIASTRWSSRPPLVQVLNIVLRALALLLSFVSAMSLNSPSAKSKKTSADPRFQDYQSLTYLLMVNISAFIYSAYQLFKGIWDIAYRGFWITEKTSDYLSFIFDQMIGYLLISSSSVAVLTIQQIDSSKSLWKAAVVCVTMSFVSFLVVQSCAMLSGYKLFKRIVW